MAVDWSMANVKMLDRMGHDGPARAAQEPLTVEPSVENMLRVILHTECHRHAHACRTKRTGSRSRSRTLERDAGRRIASP
eukprot:11020073-Heterocapsa_arctica.AAC.1